MAMPMAAAALVHLAWVNFLEVSAVGYTAPATCSNDVSISLETTRSSVLVETSFICWQMERICWFSPLI